MKQTEGTDEISCEPYMPHLGMTWIMSKARQGKTRQDKARQGKARQGKARQGKARQGKAK